MPKPGRPPKPVEISSVGQALALEIPGTLEEIGATVGIKKQVLARFRSGARKPGSKLRVQFRDLFQIPIASWDELPSGDLRAHIERDSDQESEPIQFTAPPATEPEKGSHAPRPTKDRATVAAPVIGPPPDLGPPPPAEPAYVPPPVALDQPGAARAMLEEQIARLRHDRQKARVGQLDTATLLKLEEAERRASVELAKMSGELSRADENRLAKTATFRAHLETIQRALKPWPDAYTAVAAALREADQ